MTTAVLPPLPVGWSQSRLRFVATINPSKTEVAHLAPRTEVSFVPMEAVGEDASLDTSRMKPISEVAGGYTYFRDGDILIAKITPCFENGKATLARGLAGGIGFGSTEFHVVRPSARLEARFAFYAISSSLFRDYGTASMYGAGGQKRVPTDFIADFPVPLPQLPEQRTIADFLDGEIAKIDALIAKQEELIRQIGEKRTADIRAALTHGFRAGVRLRSTGVDWVGEVPEHWKVARLGSQATIVRGASPRPAGDPKYFGSTFCPWITVASITGGRGKYVSSAEEFLTPEGVDLSRRIPANTLLLSNSGYSLGVPRIAQFSGCINDGCLAIWPHVGPESNDYFYYVLEQMTTMLRERLKQGNDQPNLNTDLAKSIMVPVPPLDEMVEISTRLDVLFKAYEHLRSAAIDFVGKLQERRSALITAAVTGQIEVAADIAAEAAA